MAALAEILTSAPTRVARWRAHKLLRRALRGNIPGLRDAAGEALADVRVAVDWALFDMLEDPWDDITGEGGAKLTRLAKRLWRKCRTPDAVVERVETAWLELRGAATRDHVDAPHPVIQAVAAAKPKLMRALARAVIVSETPEVRFALGGVLNAARSLRDRESFNAIAEAAVASVSPEPRRSVAQHPAYHWQPETVDAEDLAWTRRAAADPDPLARAHGLFALHVFSQHFTREAIDIIINADFGDDARVADLALMAFGRRTGIPFSQLTDADLGRLLHKLERISKIDHFAQEVVEHACARLPLTAVEFLLRRIDHHFVILRDWDTVPLSHPFRPLPWRHEGATTAAYLPSDHPDTAAALLAIRDQWLRSEGIARVEIGELFRAVCPSVRLAFACVEDWTANSDADLIIAAARFLGEGLGIDVLLNEHTTIARILRSAKGVSGECLREVATRLGQEATGFRAAWRESETASEQAPLAQRCTALLGEYRDDAAMQEFLKAAAARAQGMHTWLHTLPDDDE